MVTIGAVLSPDDDLDVAPLEDLRLLPLDVRALIERAERSLVAGTARLVARADVPAALDEIRR